MLNQSFRDSIVKVRPLLVTVLNLNHDSLTQLKSCERSTIKFIKPAIRREVCAGADIVDIGFERGRLKLRFFRNITLTGLKLLVRYNWLIFSLDYRRYEEVTRVANVYSVINYIAGIRDKRVLNFSSLICCFSRLVLNGSFCVLEALEYFRLVYKMFARAGRISCILDVGLGFLNSAQANFDALSLASSFRGMSALCLSRKRFLNLFLNGADDDLKSALVVAKFGAQAAFIRVHNVGLTGLILSASLYWDTF
ncbi:Dihydropteroate synthase [Candidatus Hodgkinia cicadicola]|nr:Dihydropteroate synthase [Candidatus Hodgkinia cicadicola]